MSTSRPRNGLPGELSGELGRSEGFGNYLRNGFSRIQGWCTQDLCRVASICARIQAIYSIDGGVGEIGAHHGKFLITFSLPKEMQPAVALGGFDMRQLNADRSGRGNKEIFLRNRMKYADNRQARAITGDR
jgi:hypothetical protein